MHFGEVVRVTGQGLEISAARVGSIGIQDGSRCWAQWLPNDKDKEDVRHLLISPFPYSSWPNIFRIDIRINDEPADESLAAAVSALKRIGLNIITAQFAPSTYSSGSLRVFVEPDEPCQVLLEIHNDIQIAATAAREGSEKDLTKDMDLWDRCDALTRWAMEWCVKVKQDIERANEGDEFLYKRKSKFCRIDAYQEEDEGEAGLRRSVKRHQSPEVLCTWCPDLAYAWALAGASGSFEVYYERRTACLETPPGLSPLIDRFAGPVPGDASKRAAFSTVVSFEHQQYYLRVAMNPRDLDLQKVRLSVNYEYCRPTSTEDRSTSGLVLDPASIKT